MRAQTSPLHFWGNKFSLEVTEECGLVRSVTSRLSLHKVRTRISHSPIFEKTSSLTPLFAQGTKCSAEDRREECRGLLAKIAGEWREERLPGKKLNLSSLHCKNLSSLLWSLSALCWHKVLPGPLSSLEAWGLRVKRSALGLEVRGESENS